MGKWSHDKRRGSNASLGIIMPPPGSGFAIGAVTASTIQVTRSAGFPPPATNWGPAAVDAGSGQIIQVGADASASIVLTPLNSGRTYRVYAFWAVAGSRVSEYGLVATVVTP